MKNINYCVNLVQLDKEDFGNRNYQRYLQYCLLGYRELQLRAEPKVSVAYLTMNDVGAAALPEDYQYYTKIAIVLNGCPITLSRNENIQVPRTDECGISVLDLCQCGSPSDYFNGDGFYFQSHYRAGNYVGEFYSLGSGFNAAGYFRIDYKNNQILFQNVPAVEIVMEYVSDGSDGGATLISTVAVNPIVDYCHWRLKKHSTDNINSFTKQKSLGEVQMFKDDFMESFQRYRDVVQAVTVDEFIEATYAGFQSAPKGI